MIVQKQNIGEVYSFKLVTGEEVIARLSNITDSEVTVAKPLVLSMTAKGIALTPFLFTADIKGEVSFPKNTVIAYAQTDKQTAGQYIQGTSNILTPQAANLGKLI